MHTVEALEEALVLAKELGYAVRQEWLGGVGGGACEYKGHRWLYVDLSLTPIEQIEQVATALRGNEKLSLSAVRPALRKILGLRMSA
jgi:hypothetical protein